ncbi:MAG: glucosidase [Bacteroidetes bacterium]|nr:glucosidase [Bacteroidota bacterium]MBS1972915.1 glucosidase [Bacteroidota bacterium]
MNIERQRLQNKEWKKWGPYISDRQWGTVREDYSFNGDAWNYTTHDMARSKAWRWGEEGIAGICDDKQQICFAVSLWNKKDPIIKERLFGLTGEEGNHGEDVKELYYYLDSAPTHSYMKMLYKYPQAEFPYKWLVDENKRRTRLDPEFELIDTGIFNDDQYFDVLVEYAKADEEDILIKISVLNHSNKSASLNLLPTIWFRNTWAWGYDDYKPGLFAISDNVIALQHRNAGDFKLYCGNNSLLLFCDNETNNLKLFNCDDCKKYYKDGINDFIVHGAHTVNPDRGGTKAAANYDLAIGPNQTQVVSLRFSNKDLSNPFDDFENIFNQRINEANEFYAELQKDLPNDDEKLIQRQAMAGMLWNKQFYYYDIAQWLKGDPSQPAPPKERLEGRNSDWKHLNNADIISMPDKWEYPWYASWDLGFHCISLALIDPAFAKKQLMLLTREWYMHPNGQLPAYEWSFSDTNPPVHAWAAYRVYELDWQQNDGKRDTRFLEAIFHKLLINFTWWVNRKDAEGNNIFEGGFLGMDNISLFDRDQQLPDGAHLEQSDGTSWMAMYSLNLMRMALELAQTNAVYQDMATKFFEHFLYIAGAMASMGENNSGLWDEEDEFFYDIIRMPDGEVIKLKIRSMVGLVPLFAVEVLDDELLQSQPEFMERMKWFLNYRPDLANLVSRWHEKGTDEKHLLSLLRGHRMKRILYRMLDETEFLSEYGIRALSKFHELHPYEFNVNGRKLSVQYTPGESTTPLFGGNSNWRGPVWMPVNFLIIESLQRFHHYYGDDFKVEYPSNSGQYLSLNDIATELGNRLSRIFLKDHNDRRPVFGTNNKFQFDPNFNNYILFYEYFHGDYGKGIGASHQTGWTGLIAKVLQPRKLAN